MINIKNLTFTYPGDAEPILNDITLQVEKGDFLAVVGNNGCGKSTFCKTLNGLIPHFITGDFKGTVEIDGLDTTKHDVGTLTCKAGYVYQDFENQIVRPTVLDDASYACLNYAMEDYEEKGREALRICGLGDKEKNYIWQLSGGQKHLLALSGVAALCPDVLILDEPIAQLDPRHAKQIYDVLYDLNVNYGKTIIVIEHHTDFIAEYCKHVVLMSDGRIMWKLPVKEALTRVKELESNDIFPPQVTMAASRMQESGVLPNESTLPTTVEEGLDTFKDFKFSGKSGLDKKYTKLKEPIVQFRDTSAEYRSVKGMNVNILERFDLNLYRGEKIALIGSNGAGKTTLLKLMIGLLKPSKGEVLLNGNLTKEITAEELSNTISLVYQNPEEMFIMDSIRGDIEYAIKVRQIKNYEQRTDELLKIFNLTQISDRDGRLLSGGQMRRASLAIGIALNPQILLLDEPTANLDIATRKDIMKTLNMLKDITETVVIATHDMQLVCEWADRIIVLSSGKIIADGNRDQIFENKEVTEIVGIRPPEIYVMGQALSPEAQIYTVEDFINEFRKEENNNAYKID